MVRAWQAAVATGGIPSEVQALLATQPTLGTLNPLLALPAHATTLPGAGAARRPVLTSELLVLARAADGLATIVVLAGARTAGAGPIDVPERAAARAEVAAVLGVPAVPDALGWELVAGLAAALVEADAFAATHAVLLVHALAPARRPAGGEGPATPPAAPPDDLATLARLLGAELRPGALTSIARGGGRWLHLGVASGASAPVAPPSPDTLLRDQLGAIFGGPIASEASSLLAYGNPVEVLVRADPHTVHVELPVVEWRGPTRVLTGERRASFPREAVTRLGGEAPFIHAVLAARAERLARYRVCAACGERTPPEAMHSATLCARCASRP